MHGYDLIVIGGGSAGLSCAKNAAKLGAKVALFSFVEPTSNGVSWELGGESVNSVCLPKKIAHLSASIPNLTGPYANHLGYKVSRTEFHWERLMDNIADYVRNTNNNAKEDLIKYQITYIKAFASIETSNAVSYFDPVDEVFTIAKAKYIVIAVGARPYVPPIITVPEYVLTTEELFCLNRPPGKTLVVGGTQIGLEYAGLLTQFGMEVTVAVPETTILEDLDCQCIEKVVSWMKSMGTVFVTGFIPDAISKNSNGRLSVSFQDNYSRTCCDEFDTVLYALDRMAETRGLNLDVINVRTNSKGKISVDNYDRTDIPTVFAIGDCASGHIEDTSISVKSGELLAKRLFGNEKKTLMDFWQVPRILFTPLEYSCIGVSEEDAIVIHGENNIEVYLSEFSSLNYHPIMTNNTAYASHDCFAKVVCQRQSPQRVIGMHFVGPHAGEIIQVRTLLFFRIVLFLICVFFIPFLFLFFFSICFSRVLH